MATENTSATWSDGVRAVSPILLGVAPFGLIFGVTAITADVPALAAWASSILIFAGASQFAIVEVFHFVEFLDGIGNFKPHFIGRKKQPFQREKAKRKRTPTGA